MEGLLHGAEFDDDEGFSDEEGFDEEILQGEIPAEGAAGSANGLAAADSADAADKTISLDVEKEGGKIVAKTPEGTRIATPSNGSGTPKPTDGPSAAAAGTVASGSSSSTASPSKPSSYASALQKKPTDWHLEFSLGSEKLSLDTTIYGAVHRFESSQSRDQGNASSAAVSSLATSSSSPYGSSSTSGAMSTQSVSRRCPVRTQRVSQKQRLSRPLRTTLPSSFLPRSRKTLHMPSCFSCSLFCMSSTWTGEKCRAAQMQAARSLHLRAQHLASLLSSTTSSLPS